MRNYGPKLTKDIEAELRAEIAAFDEKKTLEILKANAEPKKDAPNFADWKALHGSNGHNQIGNETRGYKEANPDILSEDDAIKFEKPMFSKQLVLATLELKELLSFRESQVWQMVMRDGYSVKEAATKLHIGNRTVEEYISRAKAKVIAHFKDTK